MSDLHVCTEMYMRRGMLPRIAMQKEELWKPGQEIWISFMGGTTIQRTKTSEIMSEWLEYANLTFRFLFDEEKSSTGAVRIAFMSGMGSWSYIGSQCLSVPHDEPTMNFGWLYDDTDETEWRRTVLHETGHMLGAIHEHQSPASGIKWDKNVMYDYYFKTHGWSRQMVDINIIDRYRFNMANSTYDPSSIMHYPIPAEMTTDGFSVGWNTELSFIDKEFIRGVYHSN